MFADVGAGRFVFRVGALPAQGAASAKEIGAAFQAGAEKIMLYGGAKAGSRTMLDALLPASEAFSSAVESGRLALRLTRVFRATRKVSIWQ